MDDNFRPGKAYTITVTATSAQGPAVSAGVRVLYLVASAPTTPVPCNVRVGSNPTALTTDTLIPPNYPVLINVAPGEKLAAIGTSGTTLYVTECA
jgi:hypothetical protein